MLYCTQGRREVTTVTFWPVTPLLHPGKITLWVAICNLAWHQSNRKHMNALLFLSKRWIFGFKLAQRSCVIICPFLLVYLSPSFVFTSAEESKRGDTKIPSPKLRAGEAHIFPLLMDWTLSFFFFLNCVPSPLNL